MPHTPATPPPAPPADAVREPAEADVRAYLDALPAGELAALLAEMAAAHPAVRRMLQARATAAAGGGPEVRRLRDDLTRAFRVHGYLTGARARAYAARVHAVVEEVRALLPRSPRGALALADHAIACAEAAFDHVEDAESSFTFLFDALADLHLRACEAARPDPGPLARALVERAVASEHGLFLDAAAEYATVLGDAGLAEYRAAAGRLWDAYPPLAVGERSADARRGRIAAIMERLARAAGGVEALVDVYRRELTDARCFVRIADAYRSAGDLAAAARWAERGIAELPRTGDRGLRDLLADVYHRMGRFDDAMHVVWVDFAEQPGLDGYRALRAHALRAEGAWPAWRRRALDAVRAAADAGRDETLRGRGRADVSEFVGILLWEGRVDEAWAAAREGDCREGLRFELVRRREGAHPGEAVPLYRRRIEDDVAGARYDDAVRLLLRLRDLWQRATGHTAEFADYMADLRVRHARRPRFLQHLAAAGIA
jgi:hypothetical protein